MHRAGVIAALLTLVACAESREPDPTPAEDGGPYNMIDPVPDPAAQAVEGVVAGNWRSETLDGQPALLFGPEAEPLFSILCDDREGVILQRHDVLATGGINMMEVRVGSDLRRLALNEVAGERVLRAVIPFNDDLIAQLKEGAQPIGVTAGDAGELTMPASPMVPQFITQCMRD